MKLTLDPMPAHRAGAVAKVNALFAQTPASTVMQEAAWTRKRQVAQAVKSGDEGATLAEEASLRGLTVQAFADLILSKPDPASMADARELRRQTALLAIDAAQTPAELDAILAGLK